MKELQETEVRFADDKKPEEICKIRTQYAMRWYIRKANWNKKIFYIFSFVGVLCPLINAVLAAGWNYKIVTVILASITSFVTSVLALTNARSKWENYRSAAEFLKREYTLFQAEVGLYGGEERVSVYLHTIEAFMMQIHVNWQKIFEKDDGAQSERNRK